MDCQKTGLLIRSLRKEKQMTQLELAERMNISDKTISKWERGLGCPDVSLLPELSNILGIDMETLLAGELDANQSVGGNMKKLKFYVCPDCGNLITTTSAAAISCCGKKLSALTLQKPAEQDKLKVEIVEQEYYVSSGHEMTREHYIAFTAILTGDSVLLKKMYPEWNMQTRLPYYLRGMLVWYCTRHGLFCQSL